MNREILFRGKHIHTIPGNEHLNGTLVHGYLSDENHIYDKSLECELLVDENTICQYTGERTRTGRKSMREIFWKHTLMIPFLRMLRKCV